ncbi:TetR/AcrR family transcriptional regulator [Paenibacillus pabuli]|uniref:TetR/AcrR family transcriptional regulator n=1 Tax=Paenibacillus pabuli TaxID=1472 RepID=UPI003CF43EBD
MVNQEDPRVMRTRQLIRDSFRDLLQKKGFDAMTIKDIAQKATINRATFYAHYEDKYALLEEITEHFFLGMIPEEVIHADEFTDEICNHLILLTHQYIVDFYRNCRMDSKSIASLVDEKIKRMLQQIIENIFSKGEQHLLPNAQHSKIISAMTGSAIYGAAHSWLNVGGSNPAVGLTDLVLPFVMNGLKAYRNYDEE